METIQDPAQLRPRFGGIGPRSIRIISSRSGTIRGEYASSEDSIHWQVSEQVDTLANTYEIVNREALLAWARTHPDALRALERIPDAITTHFAEAALQLEVKSDPEEPRARKLYVRIVTPLPVSDAVEAFMQVNEKLAPRLRKASGGDVVLTYDIALSED